MESISMRNTNKAPDMELADPINPIIFGRAQPERWSGKGPYGKVD
ncbi:uncharacterized protein G2W53_021056 [Senna tora]|uniref:Uncharacterized protein n=1 Tax=Senna tora TaxID=362788 RepID=A0A834TIN4_9FABA|nr:uncharacterized protein G2W53_021056 [Senna tora]